MNFKPAVSREGGVSIKQVRVGGTKLSYIEKGTGEPVVFIHGALNDLRIWTEQVELFSGHYRAIAYSRRFHPPNDKPDDYSKYSRALHADDLVEFLKALNLKRVHLVGHSYGGAIALMAALREPELVASLVLAEPSPFVELLDEEASALLAKQKVGFTEVRMWAKNGKREWAVRQFLNVMVGADMLDQLPPFARSIMLENAETLEPTLKTYYDSPLLSREHLSRLTTPALFISGEFSPQIWRLSDEHLSACLPNSENVILPAASHGLHIENPEIFNRLVLEFLAK